ncbi:MAG: response regulator [Ardenticatenia bacterium]|nr:response regulator [Ardenticatenia bacterium]
MGAGDKIRLLIVDDIPETRENLKKLLFFENDIEVIGTAGSGAEAIELAHKLQPDVILMDINMPDMDGITTIERIAKDLPHIQFIMMSVQGETDYLRRSMLAGAREFLVKPFTAEELCSSIRRVYALAQQRPTPPPPQQVAVGPSSLTPSEVSQAPDPTTAEGDQAQLICAFGAKGGVGTSTLLVNTAIALRHHLPHARIVIVDCDLQFGDVGVMLNMETTHSLADAASSADELDAQFIENLMVTHTSGVKVLLAPPSPADAELVTAEVLKRVFSLLRPHFDYILVDTRTSLSETVLTILDEADTILLIITTEIPAIKNAKVFFEVAEQLGYPESKVKLVLNKYDPRDGIGIDAIQGSIKHPILITVSDDARLTRSAVNQGIPFVTSHQRAQVTQEVMRLATTLQVTQQQAESPSSPGLPRPSTPPEQQKAKSKPSLFGRLFGGR